MPMKKANSTTKICEKAERVELYRGLASSAYGPTIFLIGLTFSLFAVSTPRRIPGRPSILSEFLKAQYLHLS